jgi:hypothetical protein
MVNVFLVVLKNYYLFIYDFLGGQFCDAAKVVMIHMKI